MHTELVEIANAIGETHKAISGPARRQNEHARQIREYGPRMERATWEFLEFQKKEVSRGTRHMPSGTPAQIARKIADWDYIEEEGRKIIAKPLLETHIAGAERILASAIRKQRADPIGDHAVDWTNEHAALFVTGVTAETKLFISEMVINGIQEGQALQQIAPNIRRYIGLNERQTTALNRLHLKMMNQGLSIDAMQPFLDKYKNKALRYRAMMIARTETAFALSEGTLKAYDDMGIQWVEWNADPMACPICEANNGTVHKIEESHLLIPAHPNCECCWIMSLKGPGERKPTRRPTHAQPVDTRQNFHRYITDEEHYAIRQWTGMEYRNIKAYLAEDAAGRASFLADMGEYGKTFKKTAESMERLFIKYKDGVAGQNIYRGMSAIDDETYAYLKAFQKGQTIQVDESMASWSADKAIGIEFTKHGPGNRVLFELKKGRKTTQELDIWKYSSQGEAEKEVLLNTKNFKVSSIKEATHEGDKYLHVIIEEVGD